MPSGGGGCAGWSPTPRRRRMCGGCSSGGWRATASRASRGSSRSGVCPARLRWTRAAMRTVGVAGGRCGRLRSSWPTRATPAARCGSGSATSDPANGHRVDPGRLDDLGAADASSADQRGGICRGAAGEGGSADEGRPDPSIPAVRARALCAVWSSVGLALGTRPRRVPLPAWLHQLPAAAGERAEQHLRARGCPTRQTQHASCSRSGRRVVTRRGRYGRSTTGGGTDDRSWRALLGD